jgi:hypothetical protein
MEPWVEPLCAIASTWRSNGNSIRAQFAAAQPSLEDAATFHALVTNRLQQHPELIDQWRSYSMDKRTAPSVYFSRDGAPLEVGFYDPGLGALDVIQHTEATEACADFIYREATWVLRRIGRPKSHTE